MASVVVVQYTTKNEHADENERLVREVFAELGERDPGGLHYCTVRLDDGVSFVHFAVLEGAENPLSSSPAFARFQAGIAERCTSGPNLSTASIVGSYAMFAS
jgi:hypothetical protein